MEPAASARERVLRTQGQGAAMTSRYPKSWREVRNEDGTVVWHERLCGQYRVLPGLEQFICLRVLDDGFLLHEIGAKDSLSAAMAFCREHLDAQLLEQGRAA